MNLLNPVNIIGGGLAGSEAAWQLAQAKIPVIIHEMRPKIKTEVHQTKHLSELVCSNSFRSDDFENNAVGVLHEEMRYANSIIMDCADKAKLPAGGALAVDRLKFSMSVEQRIKSNPYISIKRNEIKTIPKSSKWENTIIASGPLTSKSLSNYILKITDENSLAFFDAIAPIVYFDSINMKTAWFQSRYDKGIGKDYINCPLNKKEYYDFVNALIESDKKKFKNWEKDTPYFEGCMPIEVMASRGPETLRHGPMKPIGLTNSHQPNIKPYAVVQLRQDNSLGSLWNIVGFQTKMSYKAQKEVFHKIPGLFEANFARLGGLHRNTFINSPKILQKNLSYKKYSKIFFAGQITGVEGYVESAAIGLLAGIFVACKIKNKNNFLPPNSTAFGALLNHITEPTNSNNFQPMNINFGLFPNYSIKSSNLKRKEGRIEKRKFIAQKALTDSEKWTKKIKSLIH